MPTHALGDLLVHAFPDRIACQHPSDPHRYQLANGRMAGLFDDSALFGEPWLVVSELRFDPRLALVLRAAPVDEAHLRKAFADRFVERDQVRWDEARGALVSERVRAFDAIVLDSRPGGRIDPEHAAAALVEAVRDRGLEEGLDAGTGRQRQRSLPEPLPGQPERRQGITRIQREVGVGLGVTSGSSGGAGVPAAGGAVTGAGVGVGSSLTAMFSSAPDASQMPVPPPTEASSAVMQIFSSGSGIEGSWTRGDRAVFLRT